jgi:diguanylate cyclase (GGDEF)-like protein/PAS domain S-box-containing protein
MSPSPSALRPYIELAAVVLAAVAISLAAYGLVDYLLYGTEAPLQIFLVALPTLLATGLGTAFLRHRMGSSLARVKVQMEEKERECQRLNAELEERVRKRTAQLRLAASVMENTSEGVMVVDDNSIILSVNPAFTEITGYTVEEALGRTPRLLRSDTHDEAFFQAMWEQLKAAGRWQGEIWNRRKSGEIYPQWLTINRIVGSEGFKTCYVGLFTDVTEQREKEERIRHLAFHDALTGLPNRSLLFDRLQHAVLKAEREKRRVAVMFIDLNRFKGINDTLGHEVGDLLLQEVAKRLSTSLRGTDTVSRIGGDEFVVLLEDLEAPENAATVAANLIGVVSLPQEIAGYALQVGAAIGIALYPEDGRHAVELMKAADTAMYAAKEDGQESFRFFHAAMTERAAGRLRMENELRRAVQNGELELHYQPKVRLDSRLPCGVEALVRWRHPERGLVAAGEFIPLAEETGVVAGIGDWVLAQACRQLADWRGRGLDTTISLNLSARQLQKSDLAECIAALAREHRITAAGLEVEVAEKVLMAEPEKCAKVLRRLREMGVKVAVDDYGTGHAGPADLHRLPVDALKIDRSLVAAVQDGGAGIQAVAAVVAMARVLGLALVAEGVETREQAEALEAAGCAVAQGYFFARPEAADVTEVWLATRALSQN